MWYSVCSEYIIGTLTFSLIGSNTPLSRCFHTPLPLLHSLLPITLLPYNKDSIWVHIFFFWIYLGTFFIYLFIFAIFFCSKKTYYLWVHFSCCFFSDQASSEFVFRFLIVWRIFFFQFINISSTNRSFSVRSFVRNYIYQVIRYYVKVMPR